MELVVWQWIATLSIFFSIFILRHNKKQIKNLLPEAAGGWPLFGHLFALSGPDPLHITLSRMADKYGPIFSIRLGKHRALIINSWETAKECYRTNDMALSNRPGTAAMGLMGYNHAMFGLCNYGPYWRELRKISVLRLLSNRKVEALGPAREAQMRGLMRRMKECSEKMVVDMREVFSDLTLSLMTRTVAGDVETKMDAAERARWRATIRAFFKMMSVFTVSDVLPYMGWLDRLGGMHRALRRTGKSFDELLSAWLEQHKNKKIESRDDDDFMSEMVDAAEDVAREFPGFDADTINKATCQTMMVGGTDTTAVTLIWALCLLLENHHTMKRAQQELDIHVGRERLVRETDLENLVYIKAIIKETLRLLPPVPVNPREAREDCIVAGYHIPKGTHIFVNSWKIQRDPRVWVDPLVFRPERFLSTHKKVDVQGLHFELLPFGGGRRVCPAIPFALRSAELALASCLHGFNIETPSGESVDMRGSFGTTNMKATPLEVCLSPRLSPGLYV